MAANNRPTGRQKRVGTGGGNAQRRGSGLSGSGRTGGRPVGSSSGYSGRKTGLSGGLFGGSAGSSAGGSTGGSAGGSSGGMGGLFSVGNRAAGGGCLGGGCSKKIIMVILAIVVIVFIINLIKDGFGSETILTTGTYPSQNPTANTMATTDSGAMPVETNVSGKARSRYTSLRGNGADTVTVMVYMCGTDLESKSGAASADLQEILYGEISEKVNIILETGGTADWQNSVINSKTNQRYRLTNKGLQRLEDNLGKRSMVDPKTLSDFIQYSKANYPADRYMLVLWDHGGGSLTGFGYDELFKNDSMTLDEIGTALKDGGCSFDMIGFDACLMGTLETAIVLEP